MLVAFSILSLGVELAGLPKAFPCVVDLLSDGNLLPTSFRVRDIMAVAGFLKNICQ